MTTQQHAKEVGRLFDQLGGDFKNVPQGEFLCGVVPQLAGRMSLLCLIQSTEIPPVKSSHDRITEAREDFTEIERELAAGQKKIVRQAADVACLRSQYDYEISLFASVPAGSELRLVGVAERDAVFKRDQLESSLTDSFENPFFKQQPVRVGH